MCKGPGEGSPHWLTPNYLSWKTERPPGGPRIRLSLGAGDSLGHPCPSLGPLSPQTTSIGLFTSLSPREQCRRQSGHQRGPLVREKRQILGLLPW